MVKADKTENKDQKVEKSSKKSTKTLANLVRNLRNRKSKKLKNKKKQELENQFNWDQGIIINNLNLCTQKPKLQQNKPKICKQNCTKRRPPG